MLKLSVFEFERKYVINFYFLWIGNVLNLGLSLKLNLKSTVIPPGKKLARDPNSIYLIKYYTKVLIPHPCISLIIVPN